MELTPEEKAVPYSIYKIDMPEPDVSLLCHRVYIGMMKEQQEVAYYTIERDPQNNSVVCDWYTLAVISIMGFQQKLKSKNYCRFNRIACRGLGSENVKSAGFNFFTPNIMLQKNLL